MWFLFKSIRLLLTALAAWWLYSLVSGAEGAEGAWIIGLGLGQFVLWPILAMWLVPLLVRHRPPRAKRHDGAQFSPSVAHDHIAYDAHRDLLWIRDPKLGERFVRASEVLGVRTEHDWRNGTFDQRLEFQLRDIERPLWKVYFQRHSDRWIKTSQRNGAERDEWFSRMKAWTGLRTVR